MQAFTTVLDIYQKQHTATTQLQDLNCKKY